MSSLYVHVPFCASRCGYCDFNTYTASELGSGVGRDSFHELLIKEIQLMADELTGPIDTVFFGGGTPSLLGAAALNAILDAIRAEFGLAPGAEITSEANPDSVDEVMLKELRDGGFTRMSFGMQSSAPHVLRVLDRTHRPGASTQAVAWAKSAGFEHVNLDLIYGTPGETDDDMRATLADVLDAGVDHVSAYALIVEDGTALARRIARGEIPNPDDDVAADRYLLIDDTLRDAGLDWYEISNWARPGGECRHNVAYWQSHDWLGIGPGAHSHVQGQRWWNVKHPTTYGELIASGTPAEADREVLTDEQRELERLMLNLRVRDGLDAIGLDANVVDELRADGLVQEVPADRLALTQRGRLLADAVARRLMPKDS
jgi:putative oxygen-independent coproporphyrinogen III oxidase